jgi:hypothetical protein
MLRIVKDDLARGSFDQLRFNRSWLVGRARPVQNPAFGATLAHKRVHSSSGHVRRSYSNSCLRRTLTSL